MMIRGHTFFIHLWSFEGVVGILEVSNNNWNTVNLAHKLAELVVYGLHLPYQSSSKWHDAEAADWAIQPANFIISPTPVSFLHVFKWNSLISPWPEISCWNPDTSKNIISCVIYFRVIIAFQLFSLQIWDLLWIFSFWVSVQFCSFQGFISFANFLSCF